MKTETKWQRIRRKYYDDKPVPGESLIPVVIFRFKTHNDLWMHPGEFKQFKGGKNEVLSEFGIEPDELINVYHVRKYASSFPTTEWEG